MNPLLRLLLASTRITFAPEDDRGAASPEDFDVDLEADEPGPDEDFDDADDQEPADGGAQDRGEDDDDGAGARSADQPVADEVRRPSRSQARVEAALREAKEAKAEVERIRAEAQAGRVHETTQAAAVRREAHLASLDPYERNQFLAEERLRAQDERLARIEFNSMDAADRTEFSAQAARNPALSAVADDVEKELKRIRSNGNNVDRMTVAAYVLGKRALDRGAASATRQSKKGAARVEGQRARPTAGRSDTRAEPSARGDTQAARRARLEDIQL